MKTIDLDLLRTVTGGQIPAFPLPLQVPRPAAPAPTKPATPGFTPPTTMAPPKYSAGWWDLFRRAGLGK
jgi:hypothetical protein